MLGAVLVLNADYTLLEIASWQKAISLLIKEKVAVLESYANRFIRSPSVTFPFPAVVIRKKYVKNKKRLRFSRRNILARDAYTCQMCGAKPKRPSGIPDIEHLTIDHVVPRAQAKDGWVVLPWNGKKVRVTSWENVLTACQPCNFSKADRTPTQARMKMRKIPRAPTAIEIAWMSLFSYDIPDEWRDYLPKNSPWAGYWSDELDQT